MKKADILINSLFNQNRKELLNEVNLDVIRGYAQNQIVRAAQVITGRGDELNHQHFFNWHHDSGFKNDTILDHFKLQVVDKQNIPPHPEIHRAIKVEHDSDSINAFLKVVTDKDCTPEMKVDFVVKLYRRIIQNTEIKKVHSMRDMANEYMDSVASGEPDKYLERSVKIPDTNSRMRTLMGGHYIFPRIHTILGLPQRYKTSILVNILVFLIKEKKKGLYFSLEDSRHVLLKKVIAILLDIPKNDLTQNKVEIARLEELRKMTDEYLYVVDAGCSVGDVFTMIESQMAKDPVQFIMFDFVQLIRGIKGQSKKDIIGEFMEMIREVCTKYLVSVFLLSQAPKQEGQYKILSMGDEKESGAISELSRWAASANFMEKDDYTLLWNIYKGEHIGRAELEMNGKTGKIKNTYRLEKESKDG